MLGMTSYDMDPIPYSIIQLWSFGVSCWFAPTAKGGSVANVCCKDRAKVFSGTHNDKLRANGLTSGHKRNFNYIFRKN